MTIDYKESHLGLADRYLQLRLEEKSALYQQIYDRWTREARILATNGNGNIVGGGYNIRMTLDDFVDHVNRARNISPASTTTVRRDLSLIRLHVGIPELERYIFTHAK